MASVIPFFIQHQGCPHCCLFCNQLSISGSISARSNQQPQHLDATIKKWLARFKSPEKVQLGFYGGSFTCLPPEVQEQLLERVHPYLQQGLINSIRLSTRPD